MELARHGAYANHGEKCRKAKDISAAWQAGKKVLEVRCSQSLRDFNTDATYRYYVRFGLNEVGQLIDALAKSCRDIDPDELKVALRGRVPELLKIANVISMA